MPHEVIMPALGMAQDSGHLVAWHKSPGDEVRAGDILFEVETDKATMEVEAQADGVLSHVRRKAGEDVPVGEVIAQIGAADDAPVTASGDASPPDTAPDADDTAPAIPEGHGVIMPALGMAQDSGVIVAWHKAPGDAVAAADILFEVETDKATMEVEAGADGFVAALLAEAGEDAPVGETIAVISTSKPDAPVQRSRAKSAPKAAASAPAKAPAPAPKAKAAAAAPAPIKAPPPAATGGRILASPKARRLAREKGLDLARLAAAGHAQPFHAADVAVLEAMPAAAAETAPQIAAQAARRLTAELPAEGFTSFAAWAAETADLRDEAALLAGFAGAGLQRDCVVAIETPGRSRAYKVSPGPLAAIVPADEGSPPDLMVRDLRQARISHVALGAEAAPVLTLARAGHGLSITLECSAAQLGAAEALALLSEFAGRMEQPLRHLL
ncbi:MAG: pyruvate dehydrogenase [Limimaricola sp.]|uniref:biotin/lipoyl-containing protein n=1 Tax=Limimaricola sp. TaxID=2211665 RepID=UPI001E0D1742|nr:biotin/lipoyl-containing protein [Limimaricola sp.]MBI1417939.1 pyruvate dehydrogenase [Limimaricola sp.]